MRDESGHRLVVRNGCHQPRDVLTSAGSATVLFGDSAAVSAQDPEDRRGVAAAVPARAFDRRFVPALGQFLGSAKGLSSSTVSKLTETWKSEARAFAERDLSHVDFV